MKYHLDNRFNATLGIMKTNGAITFPSRAIPDAKAANTVINTALKIESPTPDKGPIRAVLVDAIASSEISLPCALCSSKARVTPITALPVYGWQL